MARQLTVTAQSWPIAGGFTISRGTKTAAEVVVVELSDNGIHGRGECVPYARYGETVDSVCAVIESIRAKLESGADRQRLQSLLPAGAARNAVDCALWDLEAKAAGKRVHELLGFAAPKPLTTAYTLSLGSAAEMGDAAAAASHRPLIKVKLGGEGDDARLRAVRAAAPRSRLIIDANEGWTPGDAASYFKLCREVGVELIEQPFPAGNDAVLADMDHPVTICADESVHGLASLDAIAGRYDAINIKLDKTGGLTEALALAAEAEARGLMIMVGCMLATSLAMAPAMIVAQHASVVDLDGPLLLAGDRDPGIRFDGSIMQPAPAELWG